MNAVLVVVLVAVMVSSSGYLGYRASPSTASRPETVSPSVRSEQPSGYAHHDDSVPNATNLYTPYTLNPTNESLGLQHGAGRRSGSGNGSSVDATPSPLSSSSVTTGYWIELNSTAFPGNARGQPNWPIGPNSWSVADDPKDGYSILFGGNLNHCNSSGCTNLGYLDATWAFVNGQWVILESPAYGPFSHGSECYQWHNGVNTSRLVSCPSARTKAAMTYDSTDGYVLLFGGTYNQTCNNCALNDTWEYSNGNWTNVTANQHLNPPGGIWSPSGSFSQAPLVNDPMDGYVLDGSCTTTTCYAFANGLWKLVNLTTNVPTPCGGGNIIPDGNLMAEDSTDGYVLGDYIDSCSPFTYSTWYSYRSGVIANSSVSTAWPSIRNYEGVAFDPDLSGVLLFGGCNLSYQCFGSNQPHLLGDTWLYSGSKWTQLESHAYGAGGSTYCYLYSNGVNTSKTALCPPVSDSMTIVYDSTDNMLWLCPWTPVPGNTTQYIYVVENLSNPVVSTHVSVVGHNVTFSEATPSGWGALVAMNWIGLPTGCGSPSSLIVNCTLTTPGTYTVSFTEERFEAGLYDNFTSANVTLLVHPKESITGIATYPVVDMGANESFRSSVSGGLAPYSTTWRFGDGSSSQSVNATHEYARSGNFTAHLWINDSIGDSMNLTTTLKVIPPLTAILNFSSSTPLLAQTVAITVNASGGLGPYEYSYVGLPYGCYSENKSTIGCLPTQSGFYNISALVHDQGNATVNVTREMHVIFDFNVVVPASTPVGKQLTIMVNTNETFNGTAINKSALFTPDGGYGTFTYNYSGLPPGCVSKDVATLTCTPTQAGNYTVTVSVHDQAGDHQAHSVVVHIVGSAPSTTPPSKSSTPGFLGLPDNDGYILIGAIVVAVVVIAAAALLMRGRGKRAAPAPSSKEEPESKEERKAEKEPSPESEKKE